MIAPVAAIGLGAYLLNRYSAVAPNDNPNTFTDNDTVEQADQSVQAFQQLQHSGAQGSLNSILINQYHFDTERPNERWWPVTQYDLHDANEDSVGKMYQMQAMLQADSVVRMSQKLLQQQAEPRSNRRRGIVETLSDGELSHPLTGETTRFQDFSFMPGNQNVTMENRALDLAYANGGDYGMRVPGQQYYWRAPRNTFRHQSKK